MAPLSPDGGSQVLRQDGERVVGCGWQRDSHGKRRAVLIGLPAVDNPSRSSLDRLIHEYELKDELDGSRAVRPLDLVRDARRTMLVLKDAGGEPLDRMLAAPLEVARFLRLAIGIAVALGRLHQRGLINGHGGRLWVTANEHRGAVFQVTLPAALDSLQALDQTLTAPRPT